MSNDITIPSIVFFTDALGITSGRLTEDQIRRATVLGESKQFAGEVQIEVDGAVLWGTLYGDAAGAGLKLGPWVYPTADDADRASCVVDESTTVEQIDAAVAQIRARR